MPASASALAKRRFDAGRFAPFDVLKVQRRTRQHFDAALQHAAGGADAGLVLIEALRGRISTHADVHAVVVAATIGIVQQDQIDVRAARRRCAVKRAATSYAVGSQLM